MEKRVLVSRWLGSRTPVLPIYDEASVSSARERVREAGREWDGPKELVETAALLASELTHNQLAHARQGYFTVSTVERNGIKGLELTAADLGPGISTPAAAITGGVASARGLGAGLSSVYRLADEVDFDSRLTEGTCIVARKFQTRVTRAPAVAVFGRPFPGEVISGDDATFFSTETGFLAAVCDGLGHGPEAREASHQAIVTIGENRQLELDDLLIRVNAALVKTRGCAISILRCDLKTLDVECVSAGDVYSHIYGRSSMNVFAAMPLVLRGTELLKRKVRVDRTKAEPHSVVVMFSDGLTSRTSLKNRPDLLRQSPVAIAQHLLETEARPNDDALVLVAKLPG